MRALSYSASDLLPPRKMIVWRKVGAESVANHGQLWLHVREHGSGLCRRYVEAKMAAERWARFTVHND